MSALGGPATVIGVGNVLLGDDGAGVRVVDLLMGDDATAARVLPPGARLVDGGTLGLQLLAHIREAGSLVVVDAVDVGAAPGTVLVRRGDELFAHGAVGELLDTARLLGWLPEATALVGIQIESTRHGHRLSEPVAAALPLAVARVAAELRALHGREEAVA